VHAVDPAVLASGFNRVDQTALEAIVQRSREQITALSAPLAGQADAAMRAVLVRGIAVGDNPRRAAALMLQRVQGAFDGGRNRALVIARTEMLDAHRAATNANHAANADVLAGWQWVAQLDKRTCPSCWAQHGSMHAVDDPGPQDHQQGRCTGVPVTKPWSQLGFAIEEPASILPDAQSVFDALPEADQLAVMGRDRLALLRSGKVAWSDLSVNRSTPGWRDSFAPRPTKDLRKRAAA
jgi:SPP1 gp7 family putative phage head morphogenesis protein